MRISRPHFRYVLWAGALAAAMGSTPEEAWSQSLFPGAADFQRAETTRLVNFDLYDDSSEVPAPAPVPAASNSPENVSPQPCVVMQPRSGFLAGAELTFLHPDFDGVTSALAIADVGVGGVGDSAVDGFYAAPRLWLGYQRGAKGIVARYWYFSESKSVFDPDLGAPDTGGGFGASSLDAYTIDLELTRAFCTRRWEMQASGGVRYASLQGDSFTSLTDTVGTGDLQFSTFQSIGFDGTGLTAGLYGRRPVNLCRRVHVFWSARSSFLWGEVHANTESTVGAADGGVAVEDTAGAIGIQDADLWIGEIQAGFEWIYPLSCSPANAFFRIAAEYQYWDVSDGVNSGGIAGVVVDGTTIQAVNAASDPRLDLIGLSIATGLTW